MHITGLNCRVIEQTGYVVNVSGFSSKLHGAIENIPIVKAATACDDPMTKITYILVLEQAFNLGNDVENTLLCPNQMRWDFPEPKRHPGCWLGEATHIGQAKLKQLNQAITEKLRSYA
jgi:hypothetical protein